MNITYKVLLKETKEIIMLLENTVWGQKGTLFSHKQVAHRIKANPKNYFFCAFVNDKLVGTVVCCERQIYLAHDNDPITGIYTRYFSVLKEYRGNKIGETLLGKVEEYFSARFISEPVIFYAYQDKKNSASIKVAENKNVEQYSLFNTFTFSRISPKKTSLISKITLEELTVRDCSSRNTFFNREVDGSFAYGIRNDKSELVCGARFLRTSWDVVRVPGWQGFILKYVASKLPYFKRLFNAKSFDFLAIDHLYISSICTPDSFSRFLESVLAKEGINIALFWADTRDPNFLFIKQIPSLGLLERLNSNVPAGIRVEHRNLSQSQIKSLKSKPFFICSADLT